jgi:long-chain acyl-CoA synthetase
VADRAGAAPERIAYGELVGRVDARAAALRAQAVAPGDRCGVVARQGPEFVVEALAVMAAGGCLVPIPDDHRGAVLDEFAARAHLHHLGLEEAAGHFRWRSFAGVGPVDGQDDSAFRALRPAYLRFTSGTTSRRKGVILGHAPILARLDAANRGLAIGPADRILWLLPMAHHFVVSILLYLREGATVLLPVSSLAAPVLDLARREGATVLYASPYHHRLLARDPSDAVFAGLRLAVSTAEGLSEEVARGFRARFGHPLRQALGIIEVGLAVMNLAHAEDKPTALGRPLPDYEVWLRGEDGRPAPDPTAPERSGEICIRGPGLFDAYLEPWTPAKALLEPDGFRTGDQGWFDADGDLHLAGRRASRIHMAGMKFFGEEVEAVLDAHPLVRRSRVSARAHPHLGEIPVAEIELAEGAAAPEPRSLRAFCRERLPLYKVPREFRVVAALPVTATGKLARTTELNGER